VAAELWAAISRNMTNTVKQEEREEGKNRQQVAKDTHAEIELSIDEAAILDYLYEHPQESHSTDGLAASVKDRPRSTDEVVSELQAAAEGETESPIERKRDVEDVERDIEVLIFKGLVAGRRTGDPGQIRYEEIHLTVAGERRAISLRHPEATVSPNHAPPARKSV
jgi:hypothetical protein